MRAPFTYILILLIMYSCSANKNVRLVGVALDAKYSAMVITKNNKVVFLQNEKWSDYYLNKKVIIKGIIDTIYMNPDTINGITTQSMRGAIPVIKDARFRRCFLCRVKKEKILDQALGEDILQK
ncbi:MAG: hypothetical protein ABF242_06500 [Flavobacteriales bacterium]